MGTKVGVAIARERRGGVLGGEAAEGLGARRPSQGGSGRRRAGAPGGLREAGADGNVSDLASGRPYGFLLQKIPWQTLSVYCSA